jgi:hypothetical protein
MGNTKVFRQIDAVSSTLGITSTANLVHCSYWHHKLDSLKGLDLTEPRLGEPVSSNGALMEVFIPCLDWLVSQVPVSGLAIITAVHEHTNTVGAALGPTGAQDPLAGKRDEVLHAWEAMYNEELLNLFERVVIAIAKRSSLEYFIGEKLHRLDQQRARINEPSTGISEYWPPLNSRFEIALLDSRGLWSAKSIYILRAWLEILFLKYWDGSANLDEAPYCRCILNMITWRSDRARTSPDYSTNNPPGTFLMPRLALELNDAKAAQSWLSMSVMERQTLHVFHYRSVFDRPQRLTFFRNVNLLTMR